MAKKKLTQVELDSIATKVRQYKQAVEDIRTMAAFRDRLEAEIKAAMGEDEEALVDNVPVFTHTWKHAYRWKEFVDDNPELAKEFEIIVEKTVLDQESLIKRHPALVRQYQSREFRLVSTTKAS